MRDRPMPASGRPSVILKQGREESIARRHPWVFSGAVAGVRGDPVPGSTVDVLSASRAWLASGAYSPRSQIRIRIWSFDEGEAVDRAFVARRLEQALARRTGLLEPGDLTACRLVNAESDGMPGLIVDRYGAFIVCQFLSAGAERWKNDIVQGLARMAGARGIYERSDTDARAKEGLEERCGLLWGEEPPEFVEISEHGVRFLVDVRRGHKTGFYLDQRENRIALDGFSKGAEVLNCFSYTGAFGVRSLHAGAAAVLNVDTSQEALELGTRNAALNNSPAGAFQCMAGDVFSTLRTFRDQGRSFDLIVLDPPKFAASASQVMAASRGYKDINLLAFKLLKPSGTLFTFSCSGHIGPELFRKIVADAAQDARRNATVIRHLTQAADHPVALAFPEGLYLKGLICRAW
ncbi:MAG TPA: class I SAM-dependent methyltransferase [Deltaproteobacteria bacterium]|nr:class I SAM-dependent methyltransferase [Deltaproteobacteria bacterium]